MNQTVSSEKINCLCAILFVVGMGILYYFGFEDLWAGIAIIAGISLSVRQFLYNRMLDIVIGLVVFGGSAVINYYEILPKTFIPVLFMMGGLYLIASQIVLYRKRRYMTQQETVMDQPAHHHDEPFGDSIHHEEGEEVTLGTHEEPLLS